LERPGPDWFTDTYARSLFDRFLTPLAGKPNLRFLQIGAYCGDASEWLLTNVLTHPTSYLIDVDTWEGSAEVAHEAIDFADVFGFYLHRLNARRGVGGHTQFRRQTSDEFFASYAGPRFDFIYIDGSHETHQVLRDAVNAEQLLTSGGLMAFDDYLWDDGSGDTPRPAIDAFLTCYRRRVTILTMGVQVWVMSQ
jgi:predicted O-methyltransferase YrrM